MFCRTITVGIYVCVCVCVCVCVRTVCMFLCRRPLIQQFLAYSFCVSTDTFSGGILPFYACIKRCVHSAIFCPEIFLTLESPRCIWNSTCSSRLSVTEHINLFTIFEVSVLFIPSITIYFHDCRIKFDVLLLQIRLVWAEILSKYKHYGFYLPLCKFGNFFVAASLCRTA